MNLATQGAVAGHTGNRFVDALPPEERARVVTDLEVVALTSGQAMHQPEKPYPWVVFPITCVLSVVATTREGDTCEVGTIGNEGASGMSTAWGETVLRTTFCQIAGSAARMPTSAFRACVSESSDFAARAFASERARMYFVEQMVICNTFHAVEKRCARWILSMADRANSDYYSITQEYLAFMLGVHRPAVTLAELSLQKGGAIDYTRGSLRIVDRPLLKSLACDCYDAMNLVFDAAVGARTEALAR